MNLSLAKPQSRKEVQPGLTRFSGLNPVHPVNPVSENLGELGVLAV
jgi:hypothetical protein